MSRAFCFFSGEVGEWVGGWLGGRGRGERERERETGRTAEVWVKTMTGRNIGWDIQHLLPRISIAPVHPAWGPALAPSSFRHSLTCSGLPLTAKLFANSIECAR